MSWQNCFDLVLISVEIFISQQRRERETGKPWPFDLNPLPGRAASEVAWVIKTPLPWRLAWVQMREQGYRRGLSCQEHLAKRLPGLWGLNPSSHESTFAQRQWVHWLTSNWQFGTTCSLMSFKSRGRSECRTEISLFLFLWPMLKSLSLRYF